VSYSFDEQEKGLGYSPVEVDDFISKARRQFEDPTQFLVSSGLARHATFTLVKGGYSIVAVDSAIDRLEDTFAQKELAKQRAEQGDFALDDRLARFVDSLQGRIERSSGKRFKRATWPLRGYAPKQVDAFCQTLERYLVSGATLTAADVRGQLFKAKRGGYAENQVDAFLDRTIEVIQLRKALGK
jgi:DivIVA domain-containing protein